MFRVIISTDTKSNSYQSGYSKWSSEKCKYTDWCIKNAIDWSCINHNTDTYVYYFKYETDALAFKIKFGL